MTTKTDNSKTIVSLTLEQDRICVTMYNGIYPRVLSIISEIVENPHKRVELTSDSSLVTDTSQLQCFPKFGCVTGQVVVTLQKGSLADFQKVYETLFQLLSSFILVVSSKE